MDNDMFTIGQQAWCSTNANFQTRKSHRISILIDWVLFTIIGKKDDHVILLLHDPYKGMLVGHSLSRLWNIEDKYFDCLCSCVPTKMLRPYNYVKCCCGNLVNSLWKRCWECELGIKTDK